MAVPRVECGEAIPMAPAPQERGAHQVGRPSEEEGKNQASPKLARGKDHQKEAAPRMEERRGPRQVERKVARAVVEGR